MANKQEEILPVPLLNLARKWRSKNFDEIIGQAIAVRMLKNSLYIGQLFPVYLFSGQRGCGKTSTARIFAAAINCERLPFFKKDPKKTIIPCSNCVSCRAMVAGKHPDCVEIDAASYTGVDHVRQIIDASSLLPLLGNKKIYLIDEAHMLSKAAFNAFLKVLEEPSASALFILATTDSEKIIETVKSRCFQILFRPIDTTILCDHLEAICVKEAIPYARDALNIIAQESQGAVRDALNILEQVRFAHERISQEAVFQVLGHVSDEQLLELFNALLNASLDEFAKKYADIVTQQTIPATLWSSFIELLRAALACLNGVSLGRFSHMQERIKEIIKGHNIRIFIDVMYVLYEHEMLFLKTASQGTFLQLLLFRCCEYVRNNSSLDLSSNINANPVITKKKASLSDTFNKDQYEEDGQIAFWKLFLNKIDALQDHLVISVFKQAIVMKFEKNIAQLSVVLPKNLMMFEDMVMNVQDQWQPLLNESFSKKVSLVIVYQEQNIESPKNALVQDSDQKLKKNDVHVVSPVNLVKIPEKVPHYQSKKQIVQKAKTIDVSDKKIWKKTNMVLDVFQGTVTELQGGEDVPL